LTALTYDQCSYNGTVKRYNDAMSAHDHVMTISRNGQVSIPAETRARWNARRVIVVDLGDRVVMRPVSDDPIAQLRGKYRGRGLPSDETRGQERQADRSRERRR